MAKSKEPFVTATGQPQLIPDAPIEGNGVQSVVAGDQIAVDSTDPENPIVTNDAQPMRWVAYVDPDNTGTHAPNGSQQYPYKTLQDAFNGLPGFTRATIVIAPSATLVGAGDLDVPGVGAGFELAIVGECGGAKSVERAGSFGYGSVCRIGGITLEAGSTNITLSLENLTCIKSGPSSGGITALGGLGGGIGITNCDLGGDITAPGHRLLLQGTAITGNINADTIEAYDSTPSGVAPSTWTAGTSITIDETTARALLDNGATVLPTPTILTVSVLSVNAGSDIAVDNTDSHNPIVSYTGLKGYHASTTADFTVPAANATVSVALTSTSGLIADNPLRIGGSLFTIDSVDSAVAITARNTGVDGNAPPASTIVSGSDAALAHGTPWSITHTTAGTFTDHIPRGASPHIDVVIRPGSGGGAGGGGGGFGFGGATGAGGGGGGGGGAGSPASAQRCTELSCSPGETLTITVGDGGAGGTGGTGGISPATAATPGNSGIAGQNSSVSGSVTGAICTASALVGVATGGNPGIAGTSTTGGAGGGAGSSQFRWCYPENVTVGAGKSGGVGGTIAGGNGANTVGNTPNPPTFGTVTLNSAGGATGGTGNAGTRGGGGAGGAGADSIGEGFGIGGTTPYAATDGVPGAGGHGGAADTNAGLTNGGKGTAGVNGQAGAGGGGGGGGGAINGTGGPGAQGGDGTKGSAGLVIVEGFML